MSECNNCSGGLHGLCSGNCYCGCTGSHKLPKHMDKKETQEKIREALTILEHLDISDPADEIDQVEEILKELLE